jgi:hypothetical protein
VGLAIVRAIACAAAIRARMRGVSAFACAVTACSFDNAASSSSCALASMPCSMRAQYLTLLLIISLILFSIGVAVVVQKGQAGTYIIRAWYTAPIDVKAQIQVVFGCCGLTYWNESAAQPCPPIAAAVNSTYCYPALVSAFNTAYSNAGGTSVAFSIVMATAMLFVICLLKGIKRQRIDHAAAQDRDNRTGNTSHSIEDPYRAELDDINSADAGAENMFDKPARRH